MRRRLAHKKSRVGRAAAAAALLLRVLPEQQPRVGAAGGDAVRRAAGAGRMACRRRVERGAIGVGRLDVRLDVRLDGDGVDPRAMTLHG